jgi:hypothetical protein
MKFDLSVLRKRGNENWQKKRSQVFKSLAFWPAVQISSAIAIVPAEKNGWVQCAEKMEL